MNNGRDSFNVVSSKNRIEVEQTVSRKLLIMKIRFYHEIYFAFYLENIYGNLEEDVCIDRKSM